MSNTIPVRICDFLKDHPPFSLMDRPDLEALSARVVVRYRKPGEFIFRQGEIPGQYFYIVREGAVKLLREEDGQRQLVDQCGEGDVFGIRPLIARDHYALTAEVLEESLIYAIPTDGLEKQYRENARVTYYLAAAFAGSRRHLDSGKVALVSDPEEKEYARFLEVQSVEHSKIPVTCDAGMPIRAAARIMTDKAVGSMIIVDETRCPKGIVTDKDLRRLVATGDTPIDAPVAAIMSSPVVTRPPQVTVAEVQMTMMRHGIHHLCLTEDGTDRSAIIGVISEHDILVLEGNSPAILIREIQRCRTAGALRAIRERGETLLRQYLLREVSIPFIASVMTELNDAMIVQAVKLAAGEMDQAPPAARFCWLTLGSAGREEQLLRTDQDNALIFEDVAPEAYEEVKGYYLSLAAKVTALLNECGFGYCPAGMMASNPKWCLSLQEWKAQFFRWIETPTPEAVMHSTIFFDFRPVYGEKNLAERLTAAIFEALDRQHIFLSHLARQALENPPPLTFFRNLMLEKSGEHKNEFDIKARAMMPLADAARVLTLQARTDGITNTFKRFEKLAETEPQNRELYQQAAEAYQILMRFRSLQGLKQGGTGRYFDPADLSKMERLNLRNTFHPIRELQALLGVRFQTAYFG